MDYREMGKRRLSCNPLQNQPRLNGFEISYFLFSPHVHTETADRSSNGNRLPYRGKEAKKQTKAADKGEARTAVLPKASSRKKWVNELTSSLLPVSFFLSVTP